MDVRRGWFRFLAVVVAAIMMAAGLIAGPWSAPDAVAAPDPVAAREVPAGGSTRAADVKPEVPRGDFSEPPGSAQSPPTSVDATTTARPPQPPAQTPTSPSVRPDLSTASITERGEKFDVYDLGGNRKVARLYSSPRNTKNDRGEWVAIDTTIVGTTSGRLEPAATDIGDVLRPAVVGEGSAVLR